jgi:hypothetical protein
MPHTIERTRLGRFALVALLALGITVGGASAITGSADARPCHNCPLEGPPPPDINDGP